MAYQVLAAVLGGAQSIAACSFDEAFAIPTEKSVRLSLRTQQILVHEAGVTDTVDPPGRLLLYRSSHKKMEHEIKELIAKIDDMGGAIATMETGFIQKGIESRAYAIQREIEEKKRIVVGMNEYKVEKELDMSLFKFNPEQAKRQIVKLQTLRKTRDQTKCQSILDVVKRVAEGEENLMPYFIEAVKAYATLGEICGVLRDSVW